MAREGKYSRRKIAECLILLSASLANPAIKIHEAYERTCISEKTRRRVGRMSWGCIFWKREGACFDLEGWMGQNQLISYSERIVPLIHRVVSQHPYLLVTQDNASSHKAARTMREFERRGMAPIEWPPFSPDLNPIELVWSYMKDYMQTRYPGLNDMRNRFRTQFRQVVQEA